MAFIYGTAVEWKVIIFQNFQTMASCELDYRLPANDSESMDYEDTDSDDDNKLQIVESPQSGTLIPRTFMRSLSAGESIMMSESNKEFPSGANNASDAVESLLLLGQGPVFSQQECKVIIFTN